jgi:hypothetical protein
MCIRDRIGTALARLIGNSPFPIQTRLWRASGAHSVSMFWYSSAARASFLMYQSRLIAICLATFSG